MMMNRTKSAVDALLKLRSFTRTPFLGLESCPSVFSLSRFYWGNPLHESGPALINPASQFSDVVDPVYEIICKRKDPLPVDDITQMLEFVTKHDVSLKKTCDSFIYRFLDALVFEDKIQEAYILLNKLIENKLCQPTTLMYNTLIKALCNDPKRTTIDDAVKLFQEMQSQPDVVTYNSLVSGLCKLQRWRKATLLLKEMLDKDISPDVETFNVLINTFCAEGRLQVASHVIYIMHERGVSPNIATYNSLIDALSVKREMDKAWSLVNDMAPNHLAPDSATYNSLVKGYCNYDTVDDLLLIYHEMNEKGFKPNRVIYYRMIVSCFWASRFGDAYKLLNDLFAQGHTLDTETYCEILHDLISKRQFESAISLFHILGDDSKLNSNMSIVKLLLDGAINNGRFDFARELFKGLNARGIKIEPEIYAMMISGFCESGLVNDAKRWFLEMEANHYWPTTDTYNSLLQGYLKNKCYDDVKMLLRKMKEVNYHYLYDSTLSMLRAPVPVELRDATVSKWIKKLTW